MAESQKIQKAQKAQKERTVVILKPDAIQRSYIGEIISRLERTGLKFIAFKFLLATEDQCWEHYHKDEAWFMQKGSRIIEDRKRQGLPIEKDALEYGKDIIRSNVEFFTASPVLAMVLEGNQAVAIVKKLVGSTEPTTSDVGTIRGDLTLDSYELSSVDGRAVRNLMHCSDSLEEATRELKIWFTDNDIINYRLVAEQILYDVNLDGILE